VQSRLAFFLRCGFKKELKRFSMLWRAQSNWIFSATKDVTPFEQGTT